ncbi:MAG: hypothetical protein K9I68_05930 [Bacteroidales bacterium]|nr:hypothetical protein [Bacteroidales bacterium]MCF8338127.1 hypothetical protein [Bacteroidales bacterium]
MNLISLYLLGINLECKLPEVHDSALSGLVIWGVTYKPRTSYGVYAVESLSGFLQENRHFLDDPVASWKT